MTGLINYMGKIDLPLDGTDVQRNDPDQGKGIAIRPVLLRKGNTRLGLYGVGNVKDQRMHFELRSNRVRMYMPKDKDDWFNILLLHQNRLINRRVIRYNCMTKDKDTWCRCRHVGTLSPATKE